MDFFNNVCPTCGGKTLTYFQFTENSGNVQLSNLLFSQNERTDQYISFTNSSKEKHLNSKVFFDLKNNRFISRKFSLDGEIYFTQMCELNSFTYESEWFIRIGSVGSDYNHFDYVRTSNNISVINNQLASTINIKNEAIGSYEINNDKISNYVYANDYDLNKSYFFFYIKEKIDEIIHEFPDNISEISFDLEKTKEMENFPFQKTREETLSYIRRKIETAFIFR